MEERRITTNTLHPKHSSALECPWKRCVLENEKYGGLIENHALLILSIHSSSGKFINTKSLKFKARTHLSCKNYSLRWGCCIHQPGSEWEENHTEMKADHPVSVQNPDSIVSAFKHQLKRQWKQAAAAEKHWNPYGFFSQLKTTIRQSNPTRAVVLWFLWSLTVWGLKAIKQVLRGIRKSACDQNGPIGDWSVQTRSPSVRWL